MATNFLKYLKDEKSKIQNKLDFLNRPKLTYRLHDLQEATYCKVLIQEYDKIISEYKNQFNVENIEADKCLDCKYYADIQTIRFCRKVKGKSIIKPEQIPEWCPLCHV